MDNTAQQHVLTPAIFRATRAGASLGFKRRTSAAETRYAMTETVAAATAYANSARDPRVSDEARLLERLPLLIPVPRAAELLGISRSAAYRCAASGDLPTAHLGGRVYIVTSRLKRLLESS